MSTAPAKRSHPLVVHFDQLGALELTPAERLVVMALLRFGDWDTGAECYPAVERIAKWAGLQRKTVQRALRRLTCQQPRRVAGALTPCLNCKSADLLVASTLPGQTTAYAVFLALGVQALLPDRAAWGTPTSAGLVDNGERAGGDILAAGGDN